VSAFTQNGAATPHAAMIKPASAGPTARLTLRPTLFKATAGCRCSLGTSCGTIDCHAGMISAAAAAARKVKASRRLDVTCPSHTISPNAATKAASVT